MLSMELSSGINVFFIFFLFKRLTAAKITNLFGMANKIVLKSNFTVTFGYFWLLLATKWVLECRTFVSGKQDEPKGWLPRFVQISRTTHSDYLNTPIGIIWTRHRDYPDSTKRLFERLVVDPLLFASAARIIINYQLSIKQNESEVH